MAIGESLVDHRYPRRRCLVALLNHAAAQQADAERVEGLLIDLVEIGDRLLPRFRHRTADDRERMGPGVERKAADDARAGDSRNGADTFEDLLVEDLDLWSDEVHVLRSLVEILRPS